jgi:hypothetical protein
VILSVPTVTEKSIGYLRTYDTTFATGENKLYDDLLS